ncbi:MAG TPA: carboxyl transferase domain-containing protein, partial [Bacteroidales bacterium]|nr:carboxyl transferase domain-containing protein [Bacteroidales bacterium]
MTKNRKVEELIAKREQISLGGGVQAIEKQKAMGKLTARERIGLLLDEGSFMEFDMFIRHEARDFDMDKKDMP